jgi:general secretion pathway protein G
LNKQADRFRQTAKPVSLLKFIRRSIMRGMNRVSYAELVIMVAIPCLAARIVAPQFVEASPEAKVCELTDELETMRAELDLYRAEHGGQLPPTETFASFEAAMTAKVGQHGPYVEKIPTNPFNGLKTVRFNGEPAGAGKAGWRLDTRSGLFQADNTGYAAL